MTAYNLSEKLDKIEEVEVGISEIYGFAESLFDERFLRVQYFRTIHAFKFQFTQPAYIVNFSIYFETRYSNI